MPSFLYFLLLLLFFFHPTVISPLFRHYLAISARTRSISHSQIFLVFVFSVFLFPYPLISLTLFHSCNWNQDGHEWEWALSAMKNQIQDMSTSRCDWSHGDYYIIILCDGHVGWYPCNLYRFVVQSTSVRVGESVRVWEWGRVWE